MKVGDKILQIRKDHRVSKLQFSKLVDVNRITLEKIEKNQVPPSFKVIEALCRHYGIPISYFDPADVDLSSVVYRSSKPIQLPARDYQKVIHAVKAYLLLENLVGVAPRKEFPLSYPVHELNPIMITHAAKICRNVLGITVAPILNLYDLLENMGIHIISLELSDESIDGFSILLPSQGIFFFLNKYITDERKVFTLAHELGHLVCNRDAYYFSIEKGKPGLELDDQAVEANEKIADSFAAGFLMPSEYIHHLIKNLNIRVEDWDLNLVQELKIRFNVSAESLLNRLFNMEIIPRSTWESIRKEILDYYLTHQNAEPGSEHFGNGTTVINQRFSNLVYLAKKRKSDKELKKILTLFPEKIIL